MDWPMIRRILLKALLLLLLLNVLFAVADGTTLLARLSLYNHVFPGRQRLPYGDDPRTSFNVTLTELDAMFASHEIQAAEEDEFRIFFIGDSSIWGFLQPVDGTVTEAVNQLGLQTSDGRPVRAYNFGYPTMSWLKDLLLLDTAMQYEPDLIVWFVTLESGTDPKQMDVPLVQLHAEQIMDLVTEYDLDQDPSDERLISSTFWSRTILGARKSLADRLRHQLYGLLWAATSIDQFLPEDFTERMEDLEPDATFQGIGEADWSDDLFALDVLDAGVEVAGAVPVVIVNEPVFISSGENSDIRYNFYYPRWVYDRYRANFAAACDASGWICYDLWDILPGTLYTDSAIHYNPEGSRRVVEELLPMLMDRIP